MLQSQQIFVRIQMDSGAAFCIFFGVLWKQVFGCKRFRNLDWVVAVVHSGRDFVANVPTLAMRVGGQMLAIILMCHPWLKLLLEMLHGRCIVFEKPKGRHGGRAAMYAAKHSNH